MCEPDLLEGMGPEPSAFEWFGCPGSGADRPTLDVRDLVPIPLEHKEVLMLRQVATIVAVLAFASASHAQQMTYQGQLSQSGANFSGTAQFKFAICKSGQTVWSTDPPAVRDLNCGEPAAAIPIAVVDGIFTTALGGGTMPAINGAAASDLSGSVLRVWVCTAGSCGLGLFTRMPDQPLTECSMALGVRQVDPNATGSLGRWDGQKLGASGVVESTDGNVGLGTATPQAKLDLLGDTSDFFGSRAMFVLRKDSVTPIGSDAGLVFQIKNELDQFGTYPTAGLFDVLDSGGNRHALDIRVTASGQSPMNSIAYFRGDGNVGIGTSSPAARLHIVSNDSARVVAFSATHLSNSLPVAVFTQFGTGTASTFASLNNLATAPTVSISTSSAGGGLDVFAGRSVAPYGVSVQCSGSSPSAAAVVAQGAGASAVTGPQAAAIDLRNGAILVSGTERAAKSVLINTPIWTPVGSCLAGTTPHAHQTGAYLDVSDTNNLIVSNSIIVATVEGELPTAIPSALSVQVLRHSPGTCTFRVTIVGCNTTVLSQLKVNYMVINPS